MKAMLLTAGLGTRLRPITDHFAKPALPFMNIPLLYYPFISMELAGANEIVFNTHYKPEQIEALVAKIPEYKGIVHLSPEPEKPLGSGGGVWKARAYLEGGGDFLVANGDEALIPSSDKIPAEFAKKHKASGALATIYVMNHKGVGTQFGGVWADKNGIVHGFGKEKPQAKIEVTGFHYVGLIMLSDRVFNFLPQGESNLLYDALMAGIKAGETVRTFFDKPSWFETGNIPDFLDATRAILHAPRASNEKAFVQGLGSRFWKSPPTLNQFNDPTNPCLIGGNVKIAGRFDARGFAVIGDDCVIGNNCVIEESVLLPGAKLADGTHIRRQIVVPS